MEKLGLAVFPGAAVVNAIPILQWLPGCGFKSFAADCPVLNQMRTAPFDFAKRKMVGSHYLR